MLREVVSLVALLLLLGCGDKGDFVLPPGSESAGREAFIALDCHRCHSVIGHRHGDPFNVEQRIEGAEKGVSVRLGGPSHVVRTYNDLVNSLVVPSHRFSDTSTSVEMPAHNDVMTVQQLVDLTAYLKARYSLWSPRYVYYQYF